MTGDLHQREFRRRLYKRVYYPRRLAPLVVEPEEDRFIPALEGDERPLRKKPDGRRGRRFTGIDGRLKILDIGVPHRSHDPVLDRKPLYGGEDDPGFENVVRAYEGDR